MELFYKDYSFFYNSYICYLNLFKLLFVVYNFWKQFMVELISILKTHPFSLHIMWF